MTPVEINKQALKKVDVPVIVYHDSLRDDLLQFYAKFPLKQMVMFQTCYHNVQEEEGRGFPESIAVDFRTNYDEGKLFRITMFVFD